MIELNRFMTTDEIRREYRVPDALADVILPDLPVIVTQEDGTRIHLESDVDEFLAIYSRRRRNAPSPDRLSEAEANITEAIGNDKMTGEELAQKAGYPYNSNFKNILSSLVKRGLIVNDRPGYRNPRSGLRQD